MCRWILFARRCSATELTLLEQVVHESSLGWLLPHQKVNLTEQSAYINSDTTELSHIMPFLYTQERQNEQPRSKSSPSLGEIHRQIQDQIN